MSKGSSGLEVKDPSHAPAASPPVAAALAAASPAAVSSPVVTPVAPGSIPTPPAAALAGAAVAPAAPVAPQPPKAPVASGMSAVVADTKPPNTVNYSDNWHLKQLAIAVRDLAMAAKKRDELYKNPDYKAFFVDDKKMVPSLKQEQATMAWDRRAVTGETQESLQGRLNGAIRVVDRAKSELSGTIERENKNLYDVDRKIEKKLSVRNDLFLRPLQLIIIDAEKKFSDAKQAYEEGKGAIKEAYEEKLKGAKKRLETGQRLAFFQPGGEPRDAAYKLVEETYQNDLKEAAQEQKTSYEQLDRDLGRAGADHDRVVNSAGIVINSFDEKNSSPIPDPVIAGRARVLSDDARAKRVAYQDDTKLISAAQLDLAVEEKQRVIPQTRVDFCGKLTSAERENFLRSQGLDQALVEELRTLDQELTQKQRAISEADTAAAKLQQLVDFASDEKRVARRQELTGLEEKLETSRKVLEGIAEGSPERQGAKVAVEQTEAKLTSFLDQQHQLEKQLQDYGIQGRTLPTRVSEETKLGASATPAEKAAENAKKALRDIEGQERRARLEIDAHLVSLGITREMLELFREKGKPKVLDDAEAAQAVITARNAGEKGFEELRQQNKEYMKSFDKETDIAKKEIMEKSEEYLYGAELMVDGAAVENARFSSKHGKDIIHIFKDDAKATGTATQAFITNGATEITWTGPNKQCERAAAAVAFKNGVDFVTQNEGSLKVVAQTMKEVQKDPRTTIDNRYAMACIALLNKQAGIPAEDVKGVDSENYSPQKWQDRLLGNNVVPGVASHKGAYIAEFLRTVISAGGTNDVAQASAELRMICNQLMRQGDQGVTSAVVTSLLDSQFKVKELPKPGATKGEDAVYTAGTLLQRALSKAELKELYNSVDGVCQAKIDGDSKAAAAGFGNFVVQSWKKASDDAQSDLKDPAKRIAVNNRLVDMADQKYDDAKFEKFAKALSNEPQAVQKQFVDDLRALHETKHGARGNEVKLAEDLLRGVSKGAASVKSSSGFADQFQALYQEFHPQPPGGALVI